MLVICTYSLDRCGALEVIDVVSNHQFALIKKEGKWTIIESAERKQALDMLAKSEEQLNSFMESATDGLILFDCDLNYLKINKTALEMVGMNQKDVLKKIF